MSSGRPSDFQSPFEGHPSGEPPLGRDFTEGRIDPEWTRLVWEVRARWTRYRSAYRALTRSALSEEPVHEYRVAARRLRAALRVCRRIAGEGPVKPLEKRIRRRFRGLRRVRDIQVMRASLTDAAAGSPALEWLFRRLRREEADLATGFRKAARRASIAGEQAVMRRVVAGLTAAARTRGPQPPTAILDEELARLQARVDARRVRVDASDLTTLHKLRIAIKRARYLMEIAAHVRRQPAASARRAAQDWQDLLGSVQDLRVLREELTRFRTAVPAGPGLEQLRSRTARKLNRAVQTVLRRKRALAGFVRSIRPAS